MVFPGHFPEVGGPRSAHHLVDGQNVDIVPQAAGEKSGQKQPLHYSESRFLLPAVPGDRLKIKEVKVKSLSTVALISGEAFLKGKIAKAELVFSV